MGSLKAVITMENEEKIVVELYEKYAPLTVKNFIDLCNKNFYSGLTFHRIVKGFVIQADVLMETAQVDQGMRSRENSAPTESIMHLNILKELFLWPEAVIRIRQARSFL